MHDPSAGANGLSEKSRCAGAIGNAFRHVPDAGLIRGKTDTAHHALFGGPGGGLIIVAVTYYISNRLLPAGSGEPAGCFPRVCL